MTKYVIIFFTVMLLTSPIVYAFDGGGSWATYGIYYTKEFVLDTAARVAAHAIYQKMIDQIAGKLTTLGPDGGPVWIQNWRRFFRGSQDLGRDVFSWQLYDAALGDQATICKFLADPIAQTFGAAFNPDNGGRSNEIYRYGEAQPFNLRTRCQLRDDFDYQKYINDWSFDPVTFRKVLESGDFYTLAALSMDEQDLQVQAEFDTTKSQGLANNGYQSVKKDGEIVTPGAIFKDIQAATITKEIDWVISTDELSELIANATTLVVNRLVDYGESVVTQDTARAPDDTKTTIPDRNLCIQIAKSNAKSKCGAGNTDPSLGTTCNSSGTTDKNGNTSGNQSCGTTSSQQLDSSCLATAEQQFREQFGCQ